jgi:hypothetical protein
VTAAEDWPGEHAVSRIVIMLITNVSFLNIFFSSENE